MAFWIDTLCVPIDREQRKLAIKKMKETYQRAEKVIVVDKFTFEARGCDLLRLQALSLSDWMTRLWTLEEGIVAGSNLFIAFADGITSLSDMLVRVRNLREDDMNQRHFSATMLFKLEFELLAKDRPKPVQLMAFAQTMHNRKTTKPQDEAICLATLLDVDLGPVLDAPTLPSVFSLMGEQLPQDIIFTPGPRSSARGFRWAPVSLLNHPTQVYSIDDQILALLDEHGLLVIKDLTRLSEPLVLDPSRPQSRDGFLQFLVYQKHAFVLELTVSSVESLEGPGICHLENVAVVHRYRRSDNWAFDSAVLISNVREVEGQINSHYVALCRVIEIGWYEKKFGHPEKDGFMVHVKGRLEKDQWVYID